MKKWFMMFGLLTVSAVLSAGEVIAHWDFTKGTIQKANQKYPLQLRGKTALVAGKDGKTMLVNGPTAREIKGGAMTNKVYNELSPAGAFQFDVKIQVKPSERKMARMTVADSKYELRKGKGPLKECSGFMFYLLRDGKQTGLIPWVLLGRGDHAISVRGSFMKAAIGSVHTVSFQYNGSDTVSFLLDGKVVSTHSVPAGGSMAKAVYPLTIGDRFGRDYYGFDGGILEAKLISLSKGEALTKAPAAPVKGAKKKVIKFVPATGTTSIFWDFSKGKLTAANGKYPFELRGDTKFVQDPKVGGMIRVGSTLRDVPVGLETDCVYEDLSPKGGFQMDVKVKFRRSDRKSPQMTLADTKYDFGSVKNKSSKSNSGFMFYLGMGSAQAGFQPQLRLGFGDHTRTVSGGYVPIAQNSTHTISCRYNGGNKVEFFMDGVLLSTHRFAWEGPIAKAVYPLVLGDRFSSRHYGFDGGIIHAKFTSFPAEGNAPELVPERLAFSRDEKNAKLTFYVKNNYTVPFKNITGKFAIAGREYNFKTDSVSPRGETKVSIPVETRLSVGRYPFTVTLNYQANGKNASARTSFVYLAAPKRHDGFVISKNICDSWEQSAQIGFNMTSYNRYIPLGEKGRLSEATSQMLDRVLFSGHRLGVLVSPNEKHVAQYPRIMRNGTKYYKNPEVSNPGFVKAMTSEAQYYLHAYSVHPGIASIEFNDERRDTSLPSYGKYEPAAFQKYAGYPIPESIQGKKGPNYRSVKGFPFSRVIPDDDKVVTYLRWFYREGDGWGPLQTALERVVKQEIKRPFFTWWAPSVRLPPVWKCSGETEYLYHWSYCYPDPLNVGTNTVEQEAMGEGDPRQKIMNEVQIIAYRDKLAPIGAKVKNEPAWVSWANNRTSGGFITLPPDMMLETQWLQISRQTHGLIYHGWGSLVDNAFRDYYRFTNGETAKVMTSFFRNVAEPFGVFLKQCGEKPRRVAILHSFASFAYADRGSYGWNRDWTSFLNLMMQWANLQPYVIYEESVLKGGLKDVKVLVLAHCDVLSESVYKKIREFQDKGGIIVADEFCVPGILPDFNVKSMAARPLRKPAESKAALQKQGLELRHQLETVYTPQAKTSSPDLVTWVRDAQHGNDLLFVVNDKRTFGDYVGQYGLVMEKGLPQDGTVTLMRKAAAIYDLISHREVRFTQEKNGISFPVSFKTSDGKMYLVCNQKIGAVSAQVQNTRPGTQMNVRLTITDNAKRPFTALCPAQLTVKDAAGKTTDDSRYICFKDGQANVTLDIPVNASLGKWQLQIRELASGKSYTTDFMIK